MSSYKVVDSTVSLLYCAKCANEALEIVSPGRLVCPDCSNVIEFDPQIVRVGQLQGTKYKMRDKRRYSFREIIDEARESAFDDVFVPSPEPGRGRTGWREKKVQPHEIRVAGVDDDSGKGWRNEPVMAIISDEMITQEEKDDAGNSSCSL